MFEGVIIRRVFFFNNNYFCIIKSPNESFLPQEALSKHQAHPYIFPIKQNMSAKLRTLAINNNYSDNQAKLEDTTRRQLNLVFVGQSLYEFLQGGQFPFVHQTKLLNKKHEMLEWCVEMCFFSQAHYMKEMLMIDMGINSEKPLENCFGNWKEVLGKWNTC